MYASKPGAAALLTWKQFVDHNSRNDTVTYWLSVMLKSLFCESCEEWKWKWCFEVVTFYDKKDDFSSSCCFSSFLIRLVLDHQWIIYIFLFVCYLFVSVLTFCPVLSNSLNSCSVSCDSSRYERNLFWNHLKIHLVSATVTAMRISVSPAPCCVRRLGTWGSAGPSAPCTCTLWYTPARWRKHNCITSQSWSV